MSTNQSVFNNYGTYEIGIKFNTTGTAGAIAPITKPDGTTKTCQGDNIVVTRTGAGTYTCVLKGTGTVKLVEDLGFIAVFQGVAPVTALDVRVLSVAQGTNDDITITVVTVATAGGVATDLTSATSVVVKGAIRTCRLDGVL